MNVEHGVDVDVDVDMSEETRVATPWRVILFNDEVHTFDEVIRQIVIAIDCSVARAEALAWQVHTKGKANVFDGGFEACFRVQSILRDIELITELRG
jgi:ATP-dependent Clp protease adaptor protein ClpS